MSPSLSSIPTPTILYREACEADFPAILAYYEKFEQHMRSLGYSLPGSTLPPGIENAARQYSAAQVWLDSFRRTLGRFGQIFVVEVNGQVAGFNRSRIKRVPPYMGDVMVGELMEVWIEPQARRLGAGEKLTRLGVEWLKAQGVHSVEVQILVDNHASLKMCQGLGMKPEITQLRLTWDNYIPE